MMIKKKSARPVNRTANITKLISVVKPVRITTGSVITGEEMSAVLNDMAENNLFFKNPELFFESVAHPFYGFNVVIA